MLRIAFIVHTFQAGGLERCVARLASHLDRSRFRPVIVCLNRSGSAAAWLEADDVPVFELNKRSGNDLGLIARFTHLLRTERINLVHSHNWGSLIETVLARTVGLVPLHVHAERGLELDEMQANIWRRRARGLASRVALASADAVVAVSQEIHDRLLSSGLPASHTFLIPNGIDALPVMDPVRERVRIRRKLGLDGSAILACSVSRLSPIKDLTTAVQSVALLTVEGLDIHLVLVGDGPERATIEAQACLAGIASRVHLVGERVDVGAWLAAADVYVNSSLYEGMSQAVLEAMAAGLPLVVTDVGENAVLVGGTSPCGRIVPAGDGHALASALGELSADRDLRARLGQNARQRQRDEFSQERMVRRYEDLYSWLANVKTPLRARFIPWRR